MTGQPPLHVRHRAEASKDESRLVNSTQDRWYLTRLDGKAFCADLDPECEVKLVESGPVQAVTAKTGWYVGADGEKLGRHVTRYFYDAGQGTIFIRDHISLAGLRSPNTSADGLERYAHAFSYRH